MEVAQTRFGSLLVALGSVLALATAAAAASAATAGGTIAEAASALRTSPVFVDDRASPTISEQQAARLRRQIEGGPAAPLYIAILPAAALAEAGGDPVEVLRELRRRVGRRGTYA
ncbi:MAG: hypothetical protein M3292_05735, partial [Actinomycetota bacterium]|nr:hypothetical protein [Actinomycetota bacterium]